MPHAMLPPTSSAASSAATGHALDRRAGPAWLATALGLCALAAGLSLLLGSQGLDTALLLELRLPRLLAAAGVGALLALSGLAMQVLLRNPLADPYVLGTSGGASTGALLALMAGGSLWLGAGVGALLAGLLLLALARRAMAAADEAPARLVLIGAMLAAVFGAASTLLLTLTPDAQLRGAVFWLVGDLSGALHGGVCLLLAAALALLLRLRATGVDRLLLGAEAAALLGEDVARLRLALVVGACGAAGAAVACAGAIGFVGLVVPQGLRLAGFNRSADLSWLAPLAGATLLMLADTLARSVAAPLELPVGALTALLGAPVFVLFLLREPR